MAAGVFDARASVNTSQPGLSPPIVIFRRLCGVWARIEDDVLITAQGCEVLTEAVPKTPAAIEKWQRGE